MKNKIYNNLNIENLVKTEWINQFDECQQHQILEGLENKLDVSIYANSRFSSFQMYQIRLGLEEKLDVSIYAKECFNSSQMSFLRFVLGNNWGLKNKEKILIFAKPEFDFQQMEEIYLGLYANIDATIYANPRFDWKQMKAFREKLENDKNYVINNRLINKNEIRKKKVDILQKI